MLDYVFVYGTLRPKHLNHGVVAEFVDTSYSATAEGLQLLAPRHNAFPYAVLRDEAITHGTLLLLTPGHQENALIACDRLEGYSAEHDDGHYLRRTITTHAPETGSVEAWVYIAGPGVRVAAMTAIPGNDWAMARLGVL
ncbi:AIG2-like family [Mycobacteroides abscessus subsp. abscessus]|nr:AIG2-like family [Mycobacteroides abscessus subsp. abscessus]